MVINELSFMAGGPAGVGIKSAGLVFGRLCSRAGLHVFGNIEYPSIIRGDHNSYQVMVSERPLRSHTKRLDVLLALDDMAIRLHEGELRPGGAILYDSQGAKTDMAPLAAKGLRCVGLPFLDIAKAAGGDQRMFNTIGVGAAMGLLDFDFNQIAEALQKTFGSKGGKVVEANVACARTAYEAARKGVSDFDMRLEPRPAPERMIVSGNEALCLGFLKAGLKFYSGYPMTPASSILTFLAQHERDFGIVVKQTEDEISAIGMATGAAYAGVRAATGTSGGGFCLMCEHLGLANMLEVPVVIVEATRPGPATGLPTRTEQGDLKFVLSAAQGEFPRIVIAPGDAEEAFQWGFEAFNIAERHQTPVLVLLDKHVCECALTREPFDTAGMKIDRGVWLNEQKLSKGERPTPYAITESGVSPRIRIGAPGGAHCQTGDEHDEYGRISEEEDVREAQVAKRMRKTQSLDVSQCGYELHGPREADVTFVGWGSTKGVILDALAELNRDGAKANFLQVRFMAPFPAQQIGEVLSGANRLIDIENNATAQLADLVREKTGVRVEERILKWTGRQFMKDELIERIKSIL